jgi:4a-hydroxytetrahydrobiopterin dehydratase
MLRLDSSQVESELLKLPCWQRAGGMIRRVYTHKDFVEAMKFVNRVADASEKAGHHPDIDIRWNKAALMLTTHSEGGLTMKDFNLAHELDALFEHPGA